jgi:4-hydroxy-tetrahydrodipicolinate synthase
MKSIMQGIWVPLVTPFRQGQVDLDAAQRLAAHLVAKGVHGLVVCGTTGEACALDEGEQTALLDAVLAAVGGDCPVLMGIGGSDTRSVVAQAQRYSEHDIAGFLLPAPAYVRPSQEGLLLHFEAVAQNSGHDIVLYNIPYRSGVNIELATLQELACNPKFVAIKECGGNMNQLIDFINETPLAVFGGEDALILSTLCLGGRGAIAAAAHIRPDLFVALYERVRDGNLAEARAIFQRLLPLIRVLFSEPNPGPVKAALARDGWIKDELRLPMTTTSVVCKNRIAEIMENLEEVLV